jgi:hypothetical protein
MLLLAGRHLLSHLVVAPGMRADALSKPKAEVQFSQKPPPLVIPKPALSAGNLLAAGAEVVDSSRDNAALRNDNSSGILKLRYETGCPLDSRCVATVS